MSNLPQDSSTAEVLRRVASAIARYGLTPSEVQALRPLIRIVLDELENTAVLDGYDFSRDIEDQAPERWTAADY